MKKIFTLIVMLAATLGMQAQDTWTIAGVKALVGSGWDATDTNNDMTAEGSVFKLVKTDVMLKAGSYQYKVLKNHAWDEAYGDPNADNNDKNAVLSVTEDAAYKVTFTFDPNKPDTEAKVSAVAEKTGAYVAPEGGSTWTVAGVQELCGSNWDPADTGNDMVLSTGTVYKWTKENVALDKGKSYGFKVCADHDWTESYGGAAGGQQTDNYMISVDKPGLYTVEISFDATEHTISVTTTWTADHQFADDVWTIVGVEALTGHNWVPNDDWDQVKDNDMTKVDEGEYELVRKNVALLQDTEYEYKAALNHSWSVSIPEGMGNNKFTFEEEDGTYDVTFVLFADSKSLDASASKSTGIESVKVLIQKSAPIYNLQGQRVSGNYRGIAIQNGKKVVVK